MTRGRFLPRPWLRVIVALAVFTILAPAARAGALELQPVRVSPHAWYVQGDSGMASAANQGFNSNAGFVVTRDSVVIISADAQAAHQSVINVMDAARRAGLVQITFATQQSGGPARQRP